MKKKVKELNEMWNIRLTPNGTFGVQQSLKEHLILRMEHLMRHAPEDTHFRYILVDVMSRSSMFIFTLLCLHVSAEQIRTSE